MNVRELIILATWNDWKTSNNKEYNDEEEEDKRFKIWKRNHNFIQQHNLEFHIGYHSFEVGHNIYSDLSIDEYHEMMMGFDADQHETYRKKSDIKTEKIQTPTSVDWRNKGCVNSIQDQKKFNCSYAFSALCAIEAQVVLCFNKI